MERRLATRKCSKICYHSCLFTHLMKINFLIGNINYIDKIISGNSIFRVLKQCKDCFLIIGLT